MIKVMNFNSCNTNGRVYLKENVTIPSLDRLFIVADALHENDSCFHGCGTQVT